MGCGRNGGDEYNHKKTQSLGPDFNQASLLNGTHLDDKIFTLIANIIVT
jgi:hypothetical protein